MMTRTRTVRQFVYAGLAIALVLVQSGCSGAQASPTETVIVDTATPQDTPTPEFTSTPKATATVIATFTPAYTPTQLPQITPPAEGKGSVTGLVLWNNKPVAKAAVWICKEFTGYDCADYKTNTDENGYYVFNNVTPGEYIVAINSFSSSWWIFYINADDSRYQEVKDGQNLVLDPWNIYKLDLRAKSPNGVISNESPTFKWDPYPDAAYYEFSIYYNYTKDVWNADYAPFVEERRSDLNEITLDEVVPACKYAWFVDAFNEQGVKIASSTQVDVINIDVPTPCPEKSEE